MSKRTKRQLDRDNLIRESVAHANGGEYRADWGLALIFAADAAERGISPAVQTARIQCAVAHLVSQPERS